MTCKECPLHEFCPDAFTEVSQYCGLQQPATEYTRVGNVLYPTYAQAEIESTLKYLLENK